jgi:hypothetical protein
MCMNYFLSLFPFFFSTYTSECINTQSTDAKASQFVCMNPATYQPFSYLGEYTKKNRKKISSSNLPAFILSRGVHQLLLPSLVHPHKTETNPHSLSSSHPLSLPLSLSPSVPLLSAYTCDAGGGGTSSSMCNSSVASRSPGMCAVCVCVYVHISSSMCNSSVASRWPDMCAVCIYVETLQTHKVVFFL